MRWRFFRSADYAGLALDLTQLNYKMLLHPMMQR
jgi:hypothetical protein